MGPAERGTGKECAKSTHLRRPQREDTSGHGKKRPHKGHSRPGDSRVRHAECFGVRILEIIQGNVGETRRCSGVRKSGREDVDQWMKRT